MLNFQAVRLLHRHGNGEYTAMVERAEHAGAASDPERSWMKGTRIFACASCTDEVILQPATESSGEAPDPTA